MKVGSVILASGSSITGAGSLDYAKWAVGAKAVLIFEAAAQTNEIQLALRTGSSDINVATSKVISNRCALSLDLPAGQYRITSLGSSVVNARASIHPIA